MSGKLSWQQVTISLKFIYRTTESSLQMGSLGSLSFGALPFYPIFPLPRMDAESQASADQDKDKRKHFNDFKGNSGSFEIILMLSPAFGRPQLLKWNWFRWPKLFLNLRPWANCMSEVIQSCIVLHKIKMVPSNPKSFSSSTMEWFGAMCSNQRALGN